MVSQIVEGNSLKTMILEINMIIQTAVKTLSVLLKEETPFITPPRINIHNEIHITTNLLKKNPLNQDQEHQDVSNQIKKQYYIFIEIHFRFNKIPFKKVNQIFFLIVYRDQQEYLNTKVELRYLFLQGLLRISIETFLEGSKIYPDVQNLRLKM